jgi:transcriptional regulator with XRE-family HTH domain
MVFRRNLKLAILASGKTQRQIAYTIGLSENHLSSIVRGWRNPNRQTRSALANLLSCSEDELFG